MKTIRCILFLLVTYLGFAQKNEEKINSKKLNTERTFTVYTPPSYESSKDKKFPVLILLDGEYLADPFNGILKYGNYWDDLPEMIVVAVNQNYGETRFNDSETDEVGLPTKEGAKFFEFIGFELLPYVQSKYRTLPYRIIAGHDTTAGFLNLYLYKEDPIFNAFISLSPEMPTNMSEQLPESLALVKKPIFYYQATSSGDLEEIQEDTKKVDEIIKTKKNDNLHYRYDVFNKLSHYSLVAEAIPNALYYIFDGYQPISKLEFNQKIAKLDKGYTQYLIDKYNYLEKNLGLKVQPRQSDFKAIEAAILKNKAYDELQILAEYSGKLFPKATLSNYHRGLYFEKTGELKRAAKEYQNAFNKEDYGDITKDYLMDRADALKGKKDTPKEETTPTEEVAPSAEPTNTDTPKEETKP